VDLATKNRINHPEPCPELVSGLLQDLIDRKSGDLMLN
jgi:hypothetical protein